MFSLFRTVQNKAGSASFFKMSQSHLVLKASHMKKCAVLDDYQRVALQMADWSVVHRDISVTTYPNHFKTEAELVKTIFDYEIIVIMRERTPFTASIFKSLPNLKLLVTSGMRNASVDLKAATEHGVVVSGTANYSEPPVELTWGLILTLARNIISENEGVRAGLWQSTIGSDLKGKELGLLGLGKTGAAVAKIGSAFGMNVSAWSQNLTRETADSFCVKLAPSKDDLIKNSDFISIHLVLSERTKNLFDKKAFEIMKSNAFLINTSRAGIVDQQALVQSLNNRQIAGAAADVFETEPLPENHPLRTLPNFIATPHLGYVTERNYKAYFGEAVENIQAFLNNSPIRQLNSVPVTTSTNVPRI